MQTDDLAVGQQRVEIDFAGVAGGNFLGADIRVAGDHLGAESLREDAGNGFANGADADQADCRILKYREQIGYDILVDDQHILV